MLETCIREFPGSIAGQDIDHQEWGIRRFPKSTKVNANTVLGSNAGTVKIFFQKISVWPWGLTASYSTRKGNPSRGLKRTGRKVNRSPPSVQRLIFNISSRRRQGRPSLLSFHFFLFLNFSSPQANAKEFLDQVTTALHISTNSSFKGKRIKHRVSDTDSVVKYTTREQTLRRFQPNLLFRPRNPSEWTNL